jgi:hypothetical protein
MRKSKFQKRREREARRPISMEDLIAKVILGGLFVAPPFAIALLTVCWVIRSEFIFDHIIPAFTWYIGLSWAYLALGFFCACLERVAATLRHHVKFSSRAIPMGRQPK